MSDLNETIIKAAMAMLIKFNNRLGRHQRESENTLKDWAQYLAVERKYTVAQVGFALNELMGAGLTFMPSAYEIEAKLKPSITSHDRAPEVAAEMLKLIRWYGKHDEQNMLEIASVEARETFIRLGDTQDIRNSENTDTVRAQLERLARSVMQSKQVEVKNEQLEKIGIVLPLKRPDFSGYLPGGDIA